jgi:hypothetical protein
MLFAGSIIPAACVAVADPSEQRSESDGVAASALAHMRPSVVREIRENDTDGHERRAKGESSPYVVGDWKFSQSDCPSGTRITADSEFRFINPTARTFTIEYAFFELDGTFCGCDREDIHPNETIVYTIAQEIEEGLFTCRGRSGAVKSIFFNLENGQVVLDGAQQVGFQTHAFAVGNGEIREPAENDPTDFLVGPVMTEAGLKGIAINDVTFQEILNIHQQCVNFPPLQGP